MVRKNEICPYIKCTGCAACMNVCSHEAISMQEDEYGYWHPNIDVTCCVECGLCQKICPALHPLDLHQSRKVYAVVCHDKEEHRTSSSGGAASAISRYIVSRNGIVYGCSQKNYADIKHMRVDEVKDIVLLKGSKYVQSEIGLCFRKVKQDLQAEKQVLFVGTPCQVAGLMSYLRRGYSNLYVVDLVCHGVASQRMLREEVEKNAAVEVKNKEKIYVKFRWKTAHGVQYGLQFCQINDKGKSHALKSVKFPYNAYITAFMTGLSFRENCHHCVYAKSDRIGDLTIGDFWGLGAYQKTQIKAKEGVSLVLVNTDKGEQLLKNLQSEFVIEERTIKEAVQGNANLRAASVRPQGKDIFKKVLVEKGLKAACHAALSRKKYLRLVIVEELKRFSPLVATFKRMRLFMHQIKQ